MTETKPERATIKITLHCRDEAAWRAALDRLAASCQDADGIEMEVLSIEPSEPRQVTPAR